MKKKLKIVYKTLLIIFIFLVVFFAILMDLLITRTLFLFAAVLAGVFLVLGIYLVYLIFKAKVKGKSKVYLLLMGGAAALFLISVLLHNFFYALAIYFEGNFILNSLMEFLHVAFFLIGIPGCPIAFLVGATGGRKYLQ